MHGKFLSFAILTLLSSIAIGTEYPSQFEHKGLGKCFMDVDTFVSEILGRNALSDLNIKKTKKDSWEWIVDQTASSNYSWYILENKNNKVCFRVFIPAASQVYLTKNSHGISVSAFIEPQLEFPAKEIYLLSNVDSTFFHATHCYLLGAAKSSKNKRRKTVPCFNIYD